MPSMDRRKLQSKHSATCMKLIINKCRNLRQVRVRWEYQRLYVHKKRQIQKVNQPNNPLRLLLHNF